ncbi:MAG: hypothetical protein ACRYFZ_01640 [Janthinobacterium lividum]
MPKPDRKPDPDFEPDYDMPDAEYEETPLAEYDVGADVEYDIGADPDYDEDTQLVEESEVADPDYDEAVVDVVPVVKPEPVVFALSAVGFAFELGRAVLPLTQQEPHAVVWRGHLREPHPVTGLLHRVPVYQLADGHWDCYREEELQVA